jgi:S-DNA-T family DNA segregation ATPase FtsK/SpoIIIE
MAAQATSPPKPSRRHEVLALFAFALVVLLLFALASFDDRDILPATGDTHNHIGPVGASVAYGLYAVLGYAAYVIPFGVALLGVAALLTRPLLRWPQVVGLVLFLPTLSLLAHLTCAADLEDVAGGVLGAFLGEGLRDLVHETGAWVVTLTALTFTLLLATPFSLLVIARGAKRLWAAAERGARVHLERWRRRRARAGKAAPGAGKGAPADPERDEQAALEAKVDRALRRTRPRAQPTVEVVPSLLEESPGPAVQIDLAPAPAPPPPTAEASPSAPAKQPPPPPPAAPAPEPKIVEPRGREKPAESTAALQAQFRFPGEGKTWTLPALSLLDYDATSQVSFDREDLMRSAERLTQALSEFRVEGRVAEIHPGPVITMFEFEPAAGTKVRQIQGLEDDLALALQALKVRIAPISEKGVLGIEVANRERETVYLKEIIGADKFRKMTTKLPLALGKDISGKPVVADLTKMPHLLVAGTTGSGKSVGLNAMLVSILYSATPQDVRLILVDQKTTEFGPYDGIPHLLLPVVVDPKRAAVALRWAVEEMERRYALMSELGVRHIGSYNKKVEQQRAKGETVAAAEPEAPEVEEAEAPPPPEKLPYILILIDELADLMMVAPREVEGSLQRLAQMARAAGVHIVVATQRPSVDVISGVIRANFPARIAFQTRTKTDSRTILDDSGAEQLLGQGDMLLLPPGTSNLFRVHGAYVCDLEVNRVASFWREQGKPDYNPAILQVRDEEEGALDEDLQDEMYDQALAIVAETRQASISMLQRRLRVGYNRAARMVERMEREGLVGPPDGTSRREVYVQAADVERRRSGAAA